MDRVDEVAFSAYIWLSCGTGYVHPSGLNTTAPHTMDRKQNIRQGDTPVVTGV
jgi:hypothetical protein